MNMVSELLQKFIFLINILQGASESGLTFSEIGEKWKNKYGTDYSRRTFNNHREAIVEALGLEIECNRSTNRYFIRGIDNLSSADTTGWLIDTFTVRNLLSLSQERLSGRISVEEIPSGHRYLTTLMSAMTEDRKVRISYRKYASDHSQEYDLRPYALKEYSKRWYLIGYCEQREDLRVFGLDRVKSMEILEERFAMDESFSLEEFFATSFGIYKPIGKGKTIRFKTNQKNAQYLNDLPLHRSQKMVESDERTAIFEIFVCPDKNMYMELCKYGSMLEVISPEEVRQEMARLTEEVSKIYNNPDKL